MNQSGDLLHSILIFLAQASPILLAALGGLISEYAGLLNIGLEGIMLCGAFAAIWGASLCSSGPLGFLFGIVVALVFGLVVGKMMSLVSLRGKANIFIVGLAVNLLAAGLVSIASKALFATRGVIPWPLSINPMTMRWSFVTFSLLAVWALWFYLRSTRNGLRLRVLGSSQDMLEARGVDTHRLKDRALIASCGLAALAGATLSLQLGAFVPNQSAGKGWIALVLVFVGGRHPLGVFIACLLFVLTENTATAAQAGSDNPALLVGLPFLLVLLALMLVQGIRRARKRD